MFSMSKHLLTMVDLKFVQCHVIGVDRVSAPINAINAMQIILGECWHLGQLYNKYIYYTSIASLLRMPKLCTGLLW